MLPTYTRVVQPRNSLHSREKFLILLVLVTLCLLCFVGLFLLPDNFGGDRVLRVYKQIKNTGPDIFMPAPPIARHGINADDEDIHIIDDRAKLEAKIIKSLEETIDIPNIESNKILDGEMGFQILEKTAKPGLTFVANGEDKDPTAQALRNTVKKMMEQAWDSYKTFAWGKNELKPISKKGHSASIFGSAEIGATIVDGLDTLYIMGLQDRYNEGKDWIENHFTFENIAVELSVFETNIRYIGGLLTLYAFTGEKIFKDKAKYVADKLLPAFESETGIPYALINLKNNATRNYPWASSSSSILSEFGTLHLEFKYLSDITGNPIYSKKVDSIREFLQDIDKINGLYPNYLNPKTGHWGQHHISIGALGDSFYEYLLKAWIQSGKTDIEARNMFDEAMTAICEKMLKNSTNGLIYISELKNTLVEDKMDHLACFSGGLFALAANTKDDNNSEKFMKIGKGITNTCHQSYTQTETKLGPEAFRFSPGMEAKTTKLNEKHYILRPETFESYFILWRLTHDQKYRKWGEEAIHALQTHCKTENGFSGIKDVYKADSPKDDVQQSYFLAETLKYLYLLFSDDSLLPLDEWVFNTEAHPLPIIGSQFYRKAAVL